MTIKITYFNDTNRTKTFHSGTEEKFIRELYELEPLETIEFEIDDGNELFIKEWNNDVILFKEIKGEY